MRRNTRLAAALAAGFMAPLAALGAAGDLAAVHPVTGDIEAVGTGENGRALVLVGINAASAATTAVAGSFQIQLYTAAGATLGGAQAVALADLTEFSNAAAAGDVETGDIWQIDVTDYLAISSTAYSFDVIWVDPDTMNDSLTVDVDGFPGEGDDSDANDTLFQINRESPALASAFLNDSMDDGVMDTLFLVFNFPLLGPDEAIDNSLKFLDNGGADNPNDTDDADLTIADFEFSTDGGDTWDQFTIEDFNAIGVVANGQTFLEIDIADPANTNLDEGVLVRIDPTAGDVYDGTGNRASEGADDPGVEIEGFTDITIESVEFIASIPAGGGGVADAIKVTLSLPVSTAGNAAFWDGLALDGGGATDITVTGAAIDPEDAQCILLDVSAPGADGVAADGLGTGDADGESFELSVDDGTGVAPDDLFGNTFEGTQTVDADDAIVPVATGNFFTVDSDGDGVIDGFGICFSEPLSATAPDADGFTITRLDATIHPFAVFLENLEAGITDPEDEANEVEIMATADDDDDASDIISGFGLSSEDDEDRLTTNNCLIIMIDATMFDWDGDVMTDHVPGTFDTSFAEVAVVAEDAVIQDAAGNVLDGDFDGDVTDDMAAAVAARVEFSTGDNVAGGMQKPSEQDGDVGDSDTNNTAFVIFNEEIVDAGVDETRFRFGTGAGERFQAGDFDGIVGDGDNIAVFEDSSGGGFMPGDTFTIANENGLEDGAGVAYPGSGLSGAPDLEVLDASAPYVLLQTDINGATIHSAFLGGVDDDGFATTVTLTFSRDIKEGTEGTVDDWEVEGVDTITSVTLSGNVITLTFATDQVAAGNEVLITYLGGAIDDPALRLSSADGTMAAVAQMDDSFTARLVPEADVDGEFMAVMDIAGNISMDGFTDGAADEPGPAGTKMFGAISVPRANSIRFTMGGVAATVNDESSLEAVTNTLLGLESDLYLHVEGTEMFFTNFKDEGSNAVIRITLQATNLNAVTFTGTGSFITSVGTSVASISAGTVTICWDVLRSDDGTAYELYLDGYEIGGPAIVSSAVVTGDDGGYLLHMTAPISAFNGSLNAIGWPVILVVELPDGERYMVSSLLNASDLLGPITFQGLQRQSDPFNSDANIIFNPDLANVGMQQLYGGWNSLPFDRSSGWQRTANGVLLPSGVSNVLTGTTLAATGPFDQHGYFIDDDGNNVWTAADDDGEGRLASMVVSSRCFDFFTFTMDSNGVRTGNNINAFVGGYAAGVFNGVEDGGSPVQIGVFQFGPEISASTVFAALTGVGSFPDNLTTLGWAFVTSPVASTNLATFLSTNGSDFLIIFNRTSHDSVDIRTFGGGSGDAEEISADQAIFLHK